MSTDDLTLRTATADDYVAVAKAEEAAFHEVHTDEEREAYRPTYDLDRTLLFTDGDEIVATTAALTRDLSVPGAIIPTAHVTGVTVAATYRRRGLLTQLMKRQLTDVRAAGREPIAALFASEAAIYGRFGYGFASWRTWYTADSRSVTVTAPRSAGRLRAVEPSKAVSDMSAVFEAVRRDRPGMSGRNSHWWDARVRDLPSQRHGCTELRCLLYEGPDGVDGYALWRVKDNWGDLGPKSEVKVREFVARTPAAYAEISRFLLTVDLTRSVELPMMPADAPLPHLVDNARGLGIKAADGLFVRIVDLPGALAARRYAAPVDVVLEVTDELLPENAGRWRLSGDASGASCEPTSAAADLGLGVRELGAVFLGGTPLSSLAAASRVTELRPGALPAASTAFGWHLAPMPLEIF